jgi:serine/threonine-protein kinase SRPK3
MTSRKSYGSKNCERRSIFQSHNDFGPLRSLYILPNIADFRLAQRGNSSGLHLHLIQPHHYWAPEVVLGAGWTYSADVWNLGVLVRLHPSCTKWRCF